MSAVPKLGTLVGHEALHITLGASKKVVAFFTVLLSCVLEMHTTHHTLTDIAVTPVE